MVQPPAHLARNAQPTSPGGPTIGTSGEILSVFEDMRLDLILHSRGKAGKRGLSVHNERQGREYSGLFGTSGELVSTCLTLKAE